MLVTFRTKSYSDVILFGNIADRLIKLMGHSGTVPGALKPEDVPRALHKLKAAISEGAQMPHEDTQSSEDDSKDKDDTDGLVSLKHRALPLIELLEAANRDNEHVIWDS